ncbi:MAG: IS1 family transposase [Candidatus Thiodiazotropha sp.]
MNKLSTKHRAQILHMLVEGNSLRSTARMADVSRNTVDKLLRDAGTACLKFQDETLRNLTCNRIQCDEIWSFVGMKQKNVPDELKDEFGFGDVYTWTAIDADTKLVPCWHVGTRGAASASEFITDMASRLANRVQLTTDGHRAYLEAVEEAFGIDVDYAMLIKLYGKSEGKGDDRRYSPAECTGTEIKVVSGDPELDHISTSYVERQNLTMRTNIRRFTRLTNAFSKKVENHMHAISLHFMYYNFCRIHKSLRVTPAMEAGISDHVWSLEEVVGLIPEEPPKKRGPYKKRNKVNSN